MTARRVAVLRGAALAVLSALLTASGHLAGGGTLPDLALLAVLLPLLAGLVGTVAERLRGLPGVLGVLGAGQLALHQLLVVMSADHAHAATAAPGDPAATAAMVAVHAVVTLIGAVLVRHADAALCGLAAALRRLTPRLPVPPAVGDRAPVLVAAPAPAGPRPGLRLAAVVVRRGPPVGC